jgi:SAM-dependent methyltransferase
MPDDLRTAPFSRLHAQYEEWFDQHYTAYVSELLAVRAMLPLTGRGLEIGVGTGRFAGPLGVAFGIDPVAEVLEYACARGVRALRADGVELPFVDGAFDYVVMVTTICFLSDPEAVLQEAARVLRPHGSIIIGLVDRESPLGQMYRAHQAESDFYRAATFYSTAEIETLLSEHGFDDVTCVQTLFGPLDEIKDVQAITTGSGNGAFLVMQARLA